MKLEDSHLARRRFLCGMLGGGVAALAAGAAVPLVQFAGNFRREPPPPFLEVSQADWSLEPETARLLMYGPVPVLLLRAAAAEEVKVFVATCTHLNCTVSYQPEFQRILCACHEGVFDTNGQVASGPPPAPLREMFQARKNGKRFIALEKENLEKAS